MRPVKSRTIYWVKFSFGSGGWSNTAAGCIIIVSFCHWCSGNIWSQSWIFPCLFGSLDLSFFLCTQNYDIVAFWLSAALSFHSCSCLVFHCLLLGLSPPLQRFMYRCCRLSSRCDDAFVTHQRQPMTCGRRHKIDSLPCSHGSTIHLPSLPFFSHLGSPKEKERLPQRLSRASRCSSSTNLWVS